MNLHKSLAVTLLFLGIVSLLLGIGSVLIALVLGSSANSVGMMPGGADMASGFQTIATLSWLFGILELLLGVSSLVSSVMLFKKKEAGERKGRSRK